MAKRNWRVILVPFVLGTALVAGLGSLSRCFSPTLPACSFVCNTTDPKCPDEYECRSDNYCHLKGSSEACPYTMDLTPLPNRDMATAIDQSSGADM